ncbi:NRPS-like protein biosynthetic cluster [Penicillium canariense]|uniref:NRPS-like protein biosynthetic cluster n=1 Tax=Penicillium canariense TaxID=189055 RepID=A0A9W9ICI6_9EURO|nr:NRPS-like protein biosynthetic cluster [Penicillium canariense]KAJ5174133.1 NRPS-like protein biosynthetic cluster [Penicillium canariense]
MANHEDNVKAIIAQKFDVPIHEVTADTKLKDGLATDDLKKTQILTALSERFDIYVADEDMNDFTTTNVRLYIKAQDVIDYVGTKLWCRGTQFNYFQILDGTVRLKRKLQALLNEYTLDTPGGFYIALLAPNGYEFIIGVLAVLAIGGIVVPMPTGALPAEASYILTQCDAKYLLATSELASLAAKIKDEVNIPALIIEEASATADDNILPLASYHLDSALAVSEETPSILLFTSGTTGPPKGVLHARRTINKYARQEEAIEPNDELCIIPRGAFWSIYFTKLFQMLLTGIRVEVHNFGRNYNLIWERLREQTATKIVLSPTFWYGMMTYFQTHISVKFPRDVVDEYVKGAQYLRDTCATGAMASGRIKKFWREMCGGLPLKQLYGSTETQEISVSDGEVGSLEDDLGTPLPNVIMKLSEGDEGEVLVKTPSLFIGYLNSPDATAKRFDSAGFFKTGDLAILQDGRYIFKGRANMDLFKFYTYKVPRGNVEAALSALPYVSEAYIMPVADPQCDTRTAALVRFCENDDYPDRKKFDLQSIRDDLATDMGLPAYQLPTVLRVLREHESVPRTWSDKTAMVKAIKVFFPLDSENRICGEQTEILDVSDFMKMQTTKLWELSGMR